MKRPLKLFNRYNRISLPVIMGVYILSGLACYLWINNLLITDFDDSLHEQAHKLNVYIHKNDKFPQASMTEDWVITYQPIVQVLPTRIETSRRYDIEDQDSTDYRTLSYTLHKRDGYYLITVSKSLEALQGLSHSIALITMFTLLSVIIASLLLSHFVLKKLWHPFYVVMDILQSYKLGNAQQVLTNETGIVEFNFMNDRLQEMMHNAEKEYILLKEFTENASHEMQTPIGIIRSKLDMIVQEENLSTEQTGAIESAYLALRRLSHLGQSLLLLTKIENNQFSEAISIDLEDKIKDKVIQLQEFWLNKQITVKLRTEPAMLHINAELLDILLNNLFSNASKHNYNNGAIDIYLRHDSLLISNTGTLEEIDPKRIFVRFYKKQQHSVNNGLGLAIIKQICDQSKIEIVYQLVEQRHTFALFW